MKVLLLISDLVVGGAGRHVVDLANYLAQQGHRVWVAADRGPLETRLVGARFVHLPFHQVLPETLWHPRNLMAAVGIVRTLRQLMAHGQIDLIHAHEILEAAFARIARPRQSVPLLLTCHGVSEARWPSYGSRALRLGDYFIGVSSETVGRLAGYGCPLPKIARINCGIQRVSPADYVVEAETLRQKYSFGQGTKMVVTVARLVPQKGHDLYLEAIEEVVRVLPRTVFIWVGEGPSRPSLMSRVMALRLERHVHFVGECDDPYPYLCAADLFCLPSRWEGLPLAIGEAYRASLPVVATAVSGISEIVRDGETGCLVRPGCPAMLAAALIDLLGDEGKRAVMRERAMEYGNSSFFDPDRVHEEIVGFYSKALGI